MEIFILTDGSKLVRKDISRYTMNKVTSHGGFYHAGALVYDKRPFWQVCEVLRDINGGLYTTDRYVKQLKDILPMLADNTGSIICTNVGIFADITALQTIIPKWFRRGRVRRMEEVLNLELRDSLLSVLPTDVNNTSLMRLTSCCTSGMFRVIELSRLSWIRNKPVELAKVQEAPKDAEVPTDTEILEVVEEITDEPVEEPKTSDAAAAVIPIPQAAVNISALSEFLQLLNAGKKLTITISLS